LQGTHPSGLSKEAADGLKRSSRAISQAIDSLDADAVPSVEAKGDSLNDDEVNREGSARVLPQMFLLGTTQPMHEPEVQPDPLLSTDRIMETQMQSAHLDSATRLMLSSRRLQSDMQAFKAANPGACFEDFVRWHSPRDWVAKPKSTDSSTTEEETSAHDKRPISA